MTDMRGDALDFSVGRTLQRNKGIVACYAGLHSHVLQAIKTVSDIPCNNKP